MTMVFVYYAMGFMLFLVVTFYCVQLGWLFQGEGKIDPRGLFGLTALLAFIFVFITFVGSLQLSGWKPKLKEFDAKKAGRMMAALKSARETIGASKEQIAESSEVLWDDNAGFGVMLPKMQGATAVKMLVQDISETGFLNRLEPLEMTLGSLKNLERRENESESAGVGNETERPDVKPLTEKERKDSEDLERFEERRKAIEKYFKVELQVPNTVLPEHLRRIEEVYEAIKTGRVEYPYRRFNFELRKAQAVQLIENLERDKEKRPISVKMPVEIEVFGTRFDLGMCSLQFSDAHLKPTVEEIKDLRPTDKVELTVIPNKRPAKIIAEYEKFLKLSDVKPERKQEEPDSTS